MLIVSYCDRSISVVRHPLSVVLVMRQQFAINDNFSWTPGPISIKLHRNIAWVTLYQKRCYTSMNKMAARAKNRKNMTAPPTSLGQLESNLTGMLPMCLNTKFDTFAPHQWTGWSPELNMEKKNYMTPSPIWVGQFESNLTGIFSYVSLYLDS